jgi:hypothetical protein
LARWGSPGEEGEDVHGEEEADDAGEEPLL